MNQTYITEHINEVALYSLNWYVHSDDIVKDLRKHCIADAKYMKKYIDVSTPEKLLDAMRNNYDIYVNRKKEAGITSCFDTDPIEKRRVMWADNDIEAELYWYVIRYSNIPSNIAWLRIPIYDKFNLPQQGGYSHILRDNVFKQNDSFAGYNKSASDYFNMSRINILDRLANQIIDNYNFEHLSELLNKLGDNIAPDALDDEYWTAYSDFVDEHMKDGVLDEGYFQIHTKHFHISINTRLTIGDSMSIEVHGKLYEDTAENDTDDFSTALQENTDILKSRFDYDTFIKIANEDTELEHLNSIENIDKRFDTHDLFNFPNINYDTDNTVETGGFGYTVYKNENKLGLKMFMTTIFGCACADDQLYNGGCVCGAKF